MSTLAGGNFSLLVTLSPLCPLFLCVCVFWSLLLRDKLLSINYRQSVALLVTSPLPHSLSTSLLHSSCCRCCCWWWLSRPGGMPDVYPCWRIPRFLCGPLSLSLSRVCCLRSTEFIAVCFSIFLNGQDFRAFGISLWSHWVIVSQSDINRVSPIIAPQSILSILSHRCDR